METLKITQDDYRLAYKYKQLKPAAVSYGNNSEFMLQPSKVENGFQEAAIARRALSFDNWNDYLNVIQRCYFVRHAANFEKVLFCSCFVGSKKQVCKHALALSCKLNYQQLPENITSIVIEGPRGKGRPKVAKSGQALNRD